MPDSDSRLRGLIADYLLGELSPEQMAEVRDMLERDPESREIVELTRKLRDEMARREAGHPESELLAAYAVDPRSLSPDQLHDLEGHLDACRDCRAERDRLRQVLAPRFVPQALRDYQGSPAWGRIAVLALVAVCIVPAWLGLFRPAPNALAGRTLRLEGAWRSAEAPLPLALPSDVCRLNLAHDPWSMPGAGENPSLEIALYPEDSQAHIWLKTLSADDIRNPSGDGLLLEVPAELLPRGVYRLEIREGEPPVLGFVDQFRVR